MMLSSKVKQFFFSDMPVLGVFNYREFLCSTSESVDIFQVVKFLLYKC
jgi:hypothetical protein